MIKIIGSEEDGIVAGVALGIAIFLALCLGVYCGWTFGIKHFSWAHFKNLPETHSFE